FGMFRSDGTTGLLIFKEKNIKRFFLLNASRLDKNDEEIFSSDSDLNWIDLSISEEGLEIFADKKCCMKILATGIKSVRFNRQLVPFVQSGDYVIIR
ncbi:MAG: hypothetical protein KAX11_07240, partial [Candidatus Aminicenantes bacterium]|nr:hypothetical protein [Candidatus Aminicenantes bacterium]